MPSPAKSVGEGASEVGLVPREEPRAGDDRHSAAQPAEQLGELDRDVAATEDDERGGQFGEPTGLVGVEQIAGQVGDAIEAGESGGSSDDCPSR
jgi:hypothetical protein